MNAHAPLRAVAVALVLGVAILTMFTGQAEAKPRRPKDAGVRCVLYMVEPGEDITFVLPGTIYLPPDQPKADARKCGTDGEWHDIPFDK